MDVKESVQSVGQAGGPVCGAVRAGSAAGLDSGGADFAAEFAAADFDAGSGVVGADAAAGTDSAAAGADAAGVDFAAELAVGTGAAAGTAAGAGAVVEFGSGVGGLGSLVAAVVGVEREIARLQGRRELLLASAVELAEQLAGVGVGSRVVELAERSVAAELGVAVRVSDRSVQRQMGQAAELVGRFPCTCEALLQGSISLAHARVIREAGCGLDGVQVAAFEAVVVPLALELTPGRLRVVAVREAERLHPVVLQERFDQALGQRRVWVSPVVDGMAELRALLPAAVAVGIHSRLTQMARVYQGQVRQGCPVPDVPGGQGQGPGLSSGLGAGVRGVDQLRADVLADLLLRGAPVGFADPEGVLAAVVARVDVTIPAPVLAPDARSRAQFLADAAGGAGAADTDTDTDADTDTDTDTGSGAVGVDGAELGGGGVIDPGSARLLASAVVGWNRVLTDPVSGEVLAVDRYRPGAGLRRFLAARDSRCRFPGCGIRAAWLDADHTQDAALGGETSVGNLAGLCRRHHVLKHHSRWRVQQLGDGVLQWRSPTGRVYRDTPPCPATTIRHKSEACQDPDPPPF